MKIEVVNTLYLKSNAEKSQDVYALDIKLLDDKQIKVGDTFLSNDDNTIFFRVKSLAIGSYDFNNDIYSIQIEEPTIPLEKYEGHLFEKQ